MPALGIDGNAPDIYGCALGALTREALREMAATSDDSVPIPRPRRRRLRLSLRTWILVVGLVGVVVGTQYRRESISPKNVASLAPVAKLDKNDIYNIAWSRKRDRMAVVG